MSWMSGRYRNVIQVLVGLLLVGQLAVASAIAGSSAPQPHAPLSIAVVGDQNTAGLNNRVVWPTLMAERTGWSVSNYALPEAGFAADGTGAQSFSYQVDRAQAGHPQLILLVAGTADASVPEIEAVTDRGRRFNQQGHPRWRAGSCGRTYLVRDADTRFRLACQ